MMCNTVEKLDMLNKITKISKHRNMFYKFLDNE